MAVKAVEMVRRIRDRHYQETKDLPVEQQLQYIRMKAEMLLQDFAKRGRTASRHTQG